MRRRPPIDYVGTAFVLLVVVLVPAFLGALSNSTSPADAALTTADASATALHALDREIQNPSLTPAHALAAGPAWWNVAFPTRIALCAQDAGVAVTCSTATAIESARLL